MINLFMKCISLDFFFFQYEGDDEEVFPVTEAGGWKAAEKTDLIGTWKVCVFLQYFIS